MVTQLRILSLIGYDET